MEEISDTGCTWWILTDSLLVLEKNLTSKRRGKLIHLKSLHFKRGLSARIDAGVEEDEVSSFVV